MTDVRELIERGRYTAEHGVFDAVDACKYATVAELTDALTAALEREEALLETMRLIVAMADGEDAVLDENGDDICPFELARAELWEALHSDMTEKQFEKQFGEIDAALANYRKGTGHEG